MSDENQVDIEDTLQDELVDDTVEVSNEDNLEEAAVPAEADGEKAALDTKKAIDKSEPSQATVPKTKAGMVNAMYKEMSKMNKEKLMASYKKVMNNESKETADAEGIFEEDLTALVDSEATLSEGFRDKAEIIFEAALKSKIGEHVERLEESYAEELAEETTRIHNNLVEKVDGYLNYVVENWMNDNKLAIETGLRTEISESFMKSLHGVFTEHYIDVPEGKVDLVDELSTSKDELEEQVNATIADNVALKEQVEKLNRIVIVNEASAGLSEAQADKLKSLVADIDADDADAFTAKVASVKESYFKIKVTSNDATEEVMTEGNAYESDLSGSMSQYLAALNK